MDPYEDVAAKPGDNPKPDTPWEELETELPHPGESGDSEHGLDTAAPEDAADSSEEPPADEEDEETEVNSYGESA